MFEQRLYNAEFEIPNGAMKRGVTRRVAGIHEGGILREEFSDSPDVAYARSGMDPERKARR